MINQLQDRYISRNSYVHQLDPRTKLVVALLMLVGMGLLPMGTWWLYGFVWLLVLATSIFAKLEVGGLLKSSFVAVPFALAALTLPFTVPGEVIAYVPIVHWPITLEGLVRAGSIMAKSWISVQIAILLVMTTPLPDLLWALQNLRVPAVLISIVSFMYRYLNVLIDESDRLLRARASRSAATVGRRSGNTLLWRGKAAGFMVGSLMLRSFERSERVYQAMAARGYSGQLKQMATYKLETRDFVVMASAAILVVAIVAAGQLGAAGN